MKLALALSPPVEPMLAKASSSIPEGQGWWYEPKWDGFRTIVFKDGEEVYLQSRNGRPLARYFPEIVEDLSSGLSASLVLDGEVVVAGPGGLDFDALQSRLHPAASRVRMLSASVPATFVAFDLLCIGEDSLLSRGFLERRRLLEECTPCRCRRMVTTPGTAELAQAQEWFVRFEGAGLDGVVAKGEDSTYDPGKRSMVKVKHERTADVVVAGFRHHRAGAGVGSLLLGLYDDAGVLHHVGVSGSFDSKTRKDLLGLLEPLVVPDGGDHPWSTAGVELTGEGQRRPGGESRWSSGKDLSWVPLRPVLVAEVSYDHLQGSRLRHAATFRRWRTDRDPSSCRYDQLSVAPPEELASLLGT